MVLWAKVRSLLERHGSDLALKQPAASRCPAITGAVKTETVLVLPFAEGVEVVERLLRDGLLLGCERARLRRPLGFSVSPDEKWRGRKEGDQISHGPLPL
jgi:hypothetical protein